jgi:hypothetical protein
MFSALAVVRNFESPEDFLDFGGFTIQRIGLRFKELRDTFSSTDVNQDDWIFEKVYALLPLGPPGSPVGGVPNDIEDVLLLLRLFKTGDISFIRLAIIPPSGNTLVQFPYRAMNDLNSYSILRFEIDPADCQQWRGFADGIRASQSWNSDWFKAARRFFLCGGAKEFNPMWDDVDRILDYATALEAALVPEKDYSTRRMSRRGAAMISGDDAVEADTIVTFLKRFYEIRSRLTHGSRLGDDNREWLLKNCAQLELRVRQILVTAVQTLPPGDDERRAALSAIYEPTDDDRGEFALQKFQEIKSADVRRSTAARIARIAG